MPNDETISILDGFYRLVSRDAAEGSNRCLISPGFSTSVPQADRSTLDGVIEPEQLDIFIPLQRRERFDEWASLARENDLDLADPGSVRALADWLRDNGRAPAGISQETLTVLVAVMREYVGPAPLLASAG